MNGFVLCDNYLSWVPFLIWDFSFLVIITFITGANFFPIVHLLSFFW